VDNICTPTPIGVHTLPPLPYAYDALEPVIDTQTLQIHHDKHHKKYVDDLNITELALADARKKSDFTSIKCLERDLAFNGSGHILHSVYWTIMTKPDTGGTPSDKFMDWLSYCFGSFDAFKAQFLAATKNVEASGWGVLGFNPAFCRLEILQCEKHQDLTQWGIIPILVCDVWEHAYYLKYKNVRNDYVDAWWWVVIWCVGERRLVAAVNVTLSFVL